MHPLGRILGRCETRPSSLGAPGGGHSGGHSALDLPRPSCWGPERQSGPGREVWEYAGAWCLLSRKGEVGAGPSPGAPSGVGEVGRGEDVETRGQSGQPESQGKSPAKGSGSGGGGGLGEPGALCTWGPPPLRVRRGPPRERILGRVLASHPCRAAPGRHRRPFSPCLTGGSVGRKEDFSSGATSVLSAASVAALLPTDLHSPVKAECGTFPHFSVHDPVSGV